MTTDFEDLVAAADLRWVRYLFVDAQGQTRGKTIDASLAPSVAADGIGVPGSLLHKDTGNHYAINLWERTGDEILDHLLGAGDMVLRPDPTTFTVLPWVPDTGWVLCDLELPDGTAIPHSTRGLAARALSALADDGYTLRSGLEMEFTLFRRLESGGVEPAHRGWDLLGEATLESIEPLLAPIAGALDAVGLRPRSLEAELGPGQIEITFGPADGITTADQAILARSIIRAVAEHQGLHATFMSRPAPVGSATFPTGWHLHQSLHDQNGPSFVPTEPDELLSPTGRRWVAGLLAHAAGACLLTTPTVTGYKRYRPRAVTPDRITWSKGHRGAMIRVIGGRGNPATHVENRAGDPAANPYLLLASQVVAGRAGLAAGDEPPPPTDSPYSSADDKPLLPRTLGEATDAFAADTLWADAFGHDVAHYLLTLRVSDWARFCAAVTDWEQAEYFERF